MEKWSNPLTTCQDKGREELLQSTLPTPIDLVNLLLPKKRIMKTLLAQEHTLLMKRDEGNVDVASLPDLDF